MARYYIMKDGQRLYKRTIKEISDVAIKLANATGLGVPVHIDHGAIGAALGKQTRRLGVQRNVKFSRNPMMQGHDFSGEEWCVKGIAPNGRTSTAYANSKREAEETADYLRDNRGVRGITVRRTKAPMKSNPANRKRPPPSDGLVIYNHGKAAGRNRASRVPPAGLDTHQKAVWRKGYTAGRG